MEAHRGPGIPVAWWHWKHLTEVVAATLKDFSLLSTLAFFAKGHLSVIDFVGTFSSAHCRRTSVHLLKFTLAGSATSDVLVKAVVVHDALAGQVDQLRS